MLCFVLQSKIGTSALCSSAHVRALCDNSAAERLVVLVVCCTVVCIMFPSIRSSPTLLYAYVELVSLSYHTTTWRQRRTFLARIPVRRVTLCHARQTIASLKYYYPCTAGSTATFSQKSAGSGIRARKGPEPHNLLLSYATMLCVAFVHCGLIPSLTTLGISAGSEELRAKAATL